MIPLLSFGLLGLAGKTAIKMAPIIAPAVSTMATAAGMAISKKAAEKNDNDAVKNNNKKRAENLQKHLQTFRTLLDWPAYYLAEKLDMSRQAISNIETGKTILSVPQYLAIKLLIIERLIQLKDESFYNLISIIFNALVEFPNMYTDEQLKEIESKVNELIKLKKAKVSNDILINVFSESLFTDQDPDIILTSKAYDASEKSAYSKFSETFKSSFNENVKKFNLEL